MEAELQQRMAAAQREMAALQQIQADLAKQDRDFTARMDGLRQKLESSSNIVSAAEARKAKLQREAARIAKEMQETDAEITKHTALKQEITQSIVNMQELAASKRQDHVSDKLRTTAAPAAPGVQSGAPAAGWGASLSSLTSGFSGWGGVAAAPTAPAAVSKPSAPKPAAAAPPDLLGLGGDLIGGSPAPPGPGGVGDLLGGLGAPPAAVPASADLLGGFGGFGTSPSPPPPPPQPPAEDEFAGFGGFDAPPAGPGANPPADPFAGLM